MAKLSVLQYPDPRLRKIAAPVTQFDTALADLASNMFETMYAEEGIGLAATQVDAHIQLVVIDADPEAQARMALVNPRIVEAHGEVISEEGCLSVPDYRADVTRAEFVRVEACDLAGDALQLEAEGTLAICVQHEMDHLKGILFVDHLSRLKQDRYKKRLAKLQRTA